MQAPDGLGCFPFARHYLGNHCCFLFLGLLRCFSSAGSPSRRNTPAEAGVGCPIRTPVDQRFFAAPHGFSQLSTSFFAIACLGIHRTPLLTFPCMACTPRAPHDKTYELDFTYLAFYHTSPAQALRGPRGFTIQHVKEHPAPLMQHKAWKTPGRRSPARPSSTFAESPFILSYQ